MVQTLIKAAFILASFGWSLSVLAQSSDEAASAKTSPLADCPIQLGSRGDPTPHSSEPFECHCTAEARKLRGGYAYGSNPYDGISNICMAALHAGATGRDGGDVRVIPHPIQESYKGTLANGVFSSDWDHPSQFGSFIVEPLINQ